MLEADLDMRHYLEDTKLGANNSVNSPDNISRIKITEESENSNSDSEITPKEQQNKKPVIQQSKAHNSVVQVDKEMFQKKKIDQSRLSK